MQTLFETDSVIDKHIESIINVMLQSLPNNNPKKDSKCYLRTVNFINELYKGTFLRNKKFDNSKDKQFDSEGVFEKINNCMYDWNGVRKLILDSLQHLEESKKPEKMPWNKKYVNSISFARFFNNGYNQDGVIDCPFLHFVNPPKDSYSYTSDITITKLKENTMSLIRESAEKFCKKYFKMKNYQLSFWYDMEDWTRWFKLLKENLPSVYSEFLICCKNGNPFDDFTEYLLFVLKQKEGDKPVVNHWYFKLTYQNGNELDGYFKQWLRSGIDKGKFAFLRNLPKPINSYYTEESFQKKQTVEKKKKEVVEWDPTTFDIW